MGEGWIAILMDTCRRSVLVALLANPPLTAGTRTLRRVELAAELLGFSRVTVANLFNLPSHATGDIDELGAGPEGWMSARMRLAAQIRSADGLLLAYGASEPAGSARIHFRRQVVWVAERIEARGVEAWQVGDRPRHPSRWQRWTHRAHPGLPFQDALAQSLVRVSVPSVGAPD
ncbi:hypothetical protein GCM10027425_23590 [Alteromonas gracilis]